MALFITHAVIGASGAFAVKAKNISFLVVLTVFLSAIIPDFDVIFYEFDYIPQDLWYHNNFFHSITFAVAWSLVISSIFWKSFKILSNAWIALFTVNLLMVLIHLVLDLATLYSAGITVFSPIDESKYTIPFQILNNPPSSIKEMFSPWGLKVLKSEMLYVALPTIGIAFLTRLLGFLTDPDKN